MKSFLRNSRPVRSIVLQQEQADCGIACLLSLVHYYDGSNSLENLRRASGTTVSGTTLLGLQQAATQAGFDAEAMIADTAALIRHKDPCILHVTLENERQHYIIYYGFSCRPQDGKPGSGIFITGDPACGIKEISAQELERIWKTKYCLVLKPNTGFRRSADRKRAKKQWLKGLVKKDFPLLTIAAIIGVCIAVLGMAMAIFFQGLIDSILPGKDYAKLNTGIVLVFLLLVARESLSLVRQYFLLRQAKNLSTRITGFFYNRLLHLPKIFFDTRKTGELTARLHDLSRIQRVVSQIALSAVVDLFVIVVSAWFIFFYSWQAGTICLVVVPVFYTLVYLYRERIVNGQRAVMSAYAITESNYISTLQGIEPIKNANKQMMFADTGKIIYRDYQDKIAGLERVQAWLSFLMNVFSIVFLLSILFFCSYKVLGSELKTGEMIAIAGLCGSLLPAAANLALLAVPLNEARVAFDRMFEFASMSPEDHTGTGSDLEFRSIEATQLAFRFAGRSRILKSISFRISKGEIIAIIGENGCGKSTLTQLLQKNYTPESGRLVINDTRPLEAISVEDWRKTIGIVPQHIHIFNGTVLQNIAFEDALKNPRQVIHFLKETGLEVLINNLPQSTQTLVGEEGINLSGGQKQVIALARALYHRPQLLVLDEGTAAMDRQSELFLLQLLNKLKTDMAIIFITHKLHLLKNCCDRIYIVENGLVQACGSHDQLLASPNLYSNYWQALGQ